MSTPSDRLLGAPPRNPREFRGVKRELTAALGRGDLDAAERVAASVEGELTALPGELLEPVAMLHLARERWVEAAEALAALPARDANLEALRTYAGNLAAVRRHRPGVYAALAAAPSMTAYEIEAAAGGLPTIVRVEGARRVPVTPNADPRKNLADALALVAPLAATASPVALAGVGDGHVLSHLAANPPKSAYGNEQVVFLLEPDADLLRACLMLHDWSGDGGPIAAARFVWALGAGWADEVRGVLRSQPQVAMPTKVIGQSPRTPAIVEACRAVAAEIEEVDGERAREIERYYDELPAAAVARAMRGELGRRPRALLITSRFTTVLQFSTRDTAEGLRDNGWDARVLIEEAPHLQLTVRHIREQIAEHKPDLVIVLDHLRYEYGDVFPAGLPFACWIQDELSNLTSERAGASIGPRDFVWTCAGVTYHRDYGYPLGQCVYLEKLTRAPCRPARWESDGDDLVFVSNASQRPEALAGSIVAMAGEQAPLRELLRACCDRITATYGRGDHLHSYSQARDILHEESLRLGLPALPAATRERVVLELFTKLNNACYRQQALGWAADAAEAMGLRLSLYGQGWESHPRFASYARGPVAYGEALEAVTRRARVNLQILPYSALHQRLLDGVAAGGFFLVRDHPIDRLLPALAELTRDLPGHVRTTAAAEAVLRGEALARLGELRRAYEVLCEHRGADMVGLAWAMVEQGGEPRLRGLPRLGDVSFGDAATLRGMIERYLADPAARAEVWREQCAYVERHLTYAGDLPRVLRCMADRLMASTPGAASAPALAPGVGAGAVVEAVA